MVTGYSSPRKLIQLGIKKLTAECDDDRYRIGRRLGDKEGSQREPTNPQ